MPVATNARLLADSEDPAGPGEGLFPLQVRQWRRQRPPDCMLLGKSSAVTELLLQVLDGWSELQHGGTGEEGGRAGAARVSAAAPGGGQEDRGDLQDCKSGTDTLLICWRDVMGISFVITVASELNTLSPGVESTVRFHKIIS